MSNNDLKFIWIFSIYTAREKYININNRKYLRFESKIKITHEIFYISQFLFLDINEIN